MTIATIRQIQHNLADFVRRVEAGEEVEIRRRDRPVARIVPVTPLAERRVDWSDVQSWRRQLFGRRKPRGNPISATIYDGRGDR